MPWLSLSSKAMDNPLQAAGSTPAASFPRFRCSLVLDAPVTPSLAQILHSASIGRSLGPLQPEMVLAGEHIGMVGLVAVPAVELGLVGKLAFDLVLAARVDHEADEGEAVVVQEGLDLRDGQPVLLHMEAQVAAAAHVVEIRRLPEPADIAALGFGNNLLTEAADVVGARAIAALGNQATHVDDMLAAERAVEAEIHEAARPQQLEQNAPAGERIVKVVQHAASLDHIERAPKRVSKRAELEDVGLRIFDVGDRKLAGLAHGIAEAGEAQVDREHACAAIAAGGFDRAMAGAAARDQHVAAVSRGAARGQRWKQRAQGALDRVGLGRQRELGPARIRVVLVLIAYGERDGVIDRRERSDG